MEGEKIRENGANEELDQAGLNLDEKADQHWPMGNQTKLWEGIESKTNESGRDENLKRIQLDSGEKSNMNSRI
jgi:hypothetical protein